MFTRSAPSARLLLPLATLVLAVGACGATGATGGPSSAGPVPSQSAAAVVASSALPSATSMAPPAATAPASSGPASTAAPGGATSPVPIVVNGLVMQIYSLDEFIASDGAVSYTVVMSPATALINLRGRDIPRQLIKVAIGVQVTGTLTGSNIEAQTVLVKTSKDAA